MEILIWIVVGIIYYIAEANGSTGRMSSSRRRDGYGRYGVYGMQDDFSLEFDPLEQIRQEYNDRLKIYYQHNKPKTYLINRNCEARFIKEANGEIWFYVKSRTKGKLSGAYFEVRGDNSHVSTMWAIIDMEFNSLTKYIDIRDLYYKLNQSTMTTGGLKYFHQSLTGGLPKPIINKMAQHEFCRMEVETLPNGEKVLICSEIWGDLDINKPRKFMIKGDKLVLYGILSEFAKHKDKMLNYFDLLYMYTKRTDCEVTELNDSNTVQYMDSVTDLDQQQKDKEVIQSFKEEKQEKETSTESEQPEIKKYTERNIDL